MGFAVSAPGVTPVPESATLNGEFEASDITANVPLAAPVEVGAKLMVTVMLAPGPTVAGSVGPLIEKTVPVMVA